MSGAETKVGTFRGLGKICSDKSCSIWLRDGNECFCKSCFLARNKTSFDEVLRYLLRTKKVGIYWSQFIKRSWLSWLCRSIRRCHHENYSVNYVNRVQFVLL
jgi:hypothetical protein